MIDLLIDSMVLSAVAMIVVFIAFLPLVVGTYIDIKINSPIAFYGGLTITGYIIFTILIFLTNI